MRHLEAATWAFSLTGGTFRHLTWYWISGDTELTTCMEFTACSLHEAAHESGSDQLPRPNGLNWTDLALHRAGSHQRESLCNSRASCGRRHSSSAQELDNTLGSSLLWPSEQQCMARECESSSGASRAHHSPCGTMESLGLQKISKSIVSNRWPWCCLFFMQALKSGCKVSGTPIPAVKIILPLHWWKI